ncbi:hypothetical protein CDD83_8630 [Cordyceps sp. RAO-2017]|nr:hypothetical protein CDD83_8630 [Cordyceps sp. RAO-2017]
MSLPPTSRRHRLATPGGRHPLGPSLLALRLSNVVGAAKGARSIGRAVSAREALDGGSAGTRPVVSLSPRLVCPNTLRGGPSSADIVSRGRETRREQERGILQAGQR